MAYLPSSRNLLGILCARPGPFGQTTQHYPWRWTVLMFDARGVTTTSLLVVRILLIQGITLTPLPKGAGGVRFMLPKVHILNIICPHFVYCLIVVRLFGPEFIEILREQNVRSFSLVALPHYCRIIMVLWLLAFFEPWDIDATQPKHMKRHFQNINKAF